jgi:diguanylate cyclase (GGDEF)-like protein/PAS domain S-box-containing protein
MVTHAAIAGNSAAALLTQFDGHLRTLLESAPAVSYILRLGTTAEMVYVSPQVTAIVGWQPDDYVAHPDHWLTLVDPRDRKRVQEAVARARAAREPLHVEYRIATPDRRLVWLRDMAVPGDDAESDGQLWYGVQVDITADKAAERQLQRLAFYDPLTGLPNRRLCVDRLQAALGQGDPPRVALLFLDLDRFKVINDGIGHAAGDELLVAVAQRLAPSIAGRGTLCRFGGDEFVAMLEHFEGIPEIATVAEWLLAALQRPFACIGHELIVDGTIGIAIASPDLTTSDDLLRAADVALYRAKARGGGHFAIFDPTIDQPGLDRLEREAELRRAVERGEFQIAYQPVVDIASGQILAVEALLRWHHPERGVLSPAAFIPLAEETGLIVPLGRWVIAEACRQVRRWQERYPVAQSLQVSVNLSGRQFRQATLETDVADALRQSGLAPESLALELKEGDALAHANAVAPILQACKRLGVKVTIDDFGKGSAALRSLTQFTVDDLKIDGSCVSRLGQEPQDADIVRALVSMAKAIGLAVTAEAVETGEQLALLQALGCDRAQGRHFSPPLSVAEIEQLFASHTGSAAMGALPVTSSAP